MPPNQSTPLVSAPPSARHEPRLSRRAALLRLGAGGAGITAGINLLAAPAGAQDDRRHPDTQHLALAVGMESSLVELLEAAAAHRTVEPAVADVLLRFADHHREHAEAFTTLAAGTEPRTADRDRMVRYATDIEDATNQAAVLATVLELEEAAAATHMVALESLRQSAPVEATAATMPVEAAHAVVLARALGLPLQRWSPSTQPIAGGFHLVEEGQ